MLNFDMRILFGLLSFLRKLWANEVDPRAARALEASAENELRHKERVCLRTGRVNTTFPEQVNTKASTKNEEDKLTISMHEHIFSHVLRRYGEQKFLS